MATLRMDLETSSQDSDYAQRHSHRQGRHGSGSADSLGSHSRHSSGSESLNGSDFHEEGHTFPDREHPANVSVASLGQILHDDSKVDANKSFSLLDVKHLKGEGQKQQMVRLNKDLEAYMKDNKDLDKEIQRLMDEINKAQKNRIGQADEVNLKSKAVLAKKKEVDDLRDRQSKAKVQRRVIELANENLQGDCDKYKDQIKDLEAKIIKLSEIKDNAEHEIKKDRDESRELEEKRNKLMADQTQKKAAHQAKIDRLIAERSRAGKVQNALPPMRQQNIAVMLDNYRKDCHNDNRKPQIIIDLENQVKAAQQEAIKLDVQIRKHEVEQEHMKTRIDTLGNEIFLANGQKEHVDKQMHASKEQWEKELEILNRKLEMLEKYHKSLLGELSAAEDHLRMVLLKEQGEKERLNDEIKKMQELLNLRDEYKRASRQSSVAHR